MLSAVKAGSIFKEYIQVLISILNYSQWHKTTFVPSLMVEFRKRLKEQVLAEINEMIIEYSEHQSEEKDNNDDNNDDKSNSDDSGKSEEKTDETTPANSETLMLDATCAPQYVEYPQDINLLTK